MFCLYRYITSLVCFAFFCFDLFCFVLFFLFFMKIRECEKYQNSRIFAGDCRILEFKPDLKDFSLQGFVIKSFEVQRESDCKARCFQEHNCVSLNIGPSGNNGAYLCELSDSDHEMHSEALKPKDGFTYHSTEVSFTSKMGNNSSSLILHRKFIERVRYDIMESINSAFAIIIHVIYIYMFFSHIFHFSINFFLSIRMHRIVCSLPDFRALYRPC